MKQLTCEMCGSTDVMKIDGLFVCQSCGTKYSVEEAKKMMIEGTIEVTGSVRIDNSANLEKSLKNARRARDDDNSELAEKYYEEVIDIDPDNWEAVFYNTYFKSMQCKIANIQSAANSINNCIDTVLNLINTHVNGEKDQEKAIVEMSTRTILISTMLYNAAKSYYDGIGYQIKNNYNQEHINRVAATYATMYNLGTQLEKVHGDTKYATDLAVTAWKMGISWNNSVMGLFADKEANRTQMMEYVDKIKKYESSYQAPNIDTSSGCYIATAVYGSYDCAQVWTLRRYRDDILAKTWHGRAFVHLYYTVSPTIVKIFGETEWFKSIFRKKLDNIAERLNANGVANTPYKDK